MSKKIKQIICVVATLLMFSTMTGCGDSYDYSTIKEIKITTDKRSDYLQVKFKDETAQVDVKTKDKTFSDSLKKVDVTDNSQYIKMSDEGYLGADFKDIKLGKDENKIDIILGTETYPIKINTDNVKDGVLQINAQTKKLNALDGINFDMWKYKIVGFK